MASITIEELEIKLGLKDTIKEQSDRISGDMRNLETKVDKSTSKMGKSFVGLGIAMGVARSALSAIAQTMSGAISRVDTMNNFPRMMANLGIGSDDSQMSINRLSEGLKGLPTTINDAAMSVQRFTSSNKNIAASTEMFLALNNAVLAGSAPMEMQRSAIEQISQAYSKGKPDMMEWRALMSAMPAQLSQIAQSMGFVSADALGESLRTGSTSMNEFMMSLMQLNKEGANGFASFEEQAKNSTGGIGTSMANVKTAITRGLAEIMNAIGQSNIASFFNGIAKAINSIIPYIVAVVNVILTAVNAIASLFGSKGLGKAQKSASTGGGFGGVSNDLGAISNGAKDVGSSMGGANKQAKELQKTLAGFDSDVNILKDPNKESGSSGGGGGGTGGGVDLGGLGDFEFPDFTSGLNSMNDKAKQIYDDMMKFINQFNFDPLIASFKDMWSALQPIINLFGTAVLWLLDKVLIPLAKWTISELLPNFFKLLAAVMRVLEPVIRGFMSVGMWLLETWLIPLGKWTGAIVIASLKVLTVVLNIIGNWMKNNQPVVTAMTAVITTFFLAWKVHQLLEFVKASGGVFAALGKMTGATKLLTAVKKSDLVVSIAQGANLVRQKIMILAIAAAEALQTTAIKLSTYAKSGNVAATEAMTLAQWGAAAASKVLTVAVGVLDVAIKLLSGPIGWVIAGLTALVGIGAAMWMNSTSKETKNLSKEQIALNESIQATVDGLESVETPLSRLADDSLPKVKQSYLDVAQAFRENNLSPNTENLDNLADKTKTMYETTVGIINEKTSLMYDGLSSYYENSSVLTDEEEQAILDNVITKKQEAIDNATTHYEAIQTIQENAATEGRGMNAEERKEYQAHLDELNRIAIETITPEQARQLAELESVNAQKLAKDKDYREEYAKKLQESNEETTKKIQTQYGFELQAQNEALRTGAITEDQHRIATNEIRQKMANEQNAILETSISESFRRITGANQDQTNEYMRLNNELAKLNQEKESTYDETTRSIIDSQIAETRKKQENLGIDKDNMEAFSSFLKTLPDEYRGAFQNITNEFSVQAGIDNINNQRGQMVAAGQNMTDGLAAGINLGNWGVSNAMQTVANNAADTARRAMQIKSPSRVFMAIGKFVSQGLGLGILEDGVKAVSAIEEVSNDVLDVGNELDLSDTFKGFGNMQPNLPSYSTRLDVSTNIDDVESKMKALETILNAQLEIDSQRDYTINLNSTVELDGNQVGKSVNKHNQRLAFATGGNR